MSVVYLMLSQRSLDYPYFYLFLFIDGCVGSLMCCVWLFSCVEPEILYSCSVWASYCGGISFYRAQVLGHVGFSSCGKLTELLWHMSSRMCESVVALHRLQ